MKKIARIFLVAVALFVLTTMITAQQNKAEQLYQQALYEMEGKGDYSKAIESFNLVMTKFPKDKVTAAKALLNIGRCYEKLGKTEASKAYERILKEFKEQTQVVAEARTRLAILKQPEDVVQLKSSNRQILTESIKSQDISAPSPDGRFLSYSENNKNVLGIYDIKTGESKILSDHYSLRDSIWIEESIWSPDGKQLAYAFNDWFYHTEIHLVNADGTRHRTLWAKTDTTATYIDIHVEDWSPNGKLILALYCHGYKPSVDSEQVNIAELVVVSVDDGSIRVIKILDNWKWMHPYPKMFFSPDSRMIAYSSSTEKKGINCDVFVIAVDGSSEMNITQHPSDNRVLGWEPNGNRLLFESDRGGTNNFWATQIVNGKPQGFPKLIRNNIAKVSSMGMTNNGSLYYYLTGAELSSKDFYTESNIYLATIDPTTGKMLSQPKAATLNNNGFNHSLSWSPDGTELIYLSFFGKSNNSTRKLFILSPETGSEKEINHQFGRDSLLGGSSWFPDGKHLAASVGRMPNGENGIYKLEIETGKMISLVTSKDTNYWAPKVSPDGKLMFFESNFKGIYSFDLERKVRKLLFQMGQDQYLRNSVLSPDGKYLAFALVTYEPKYSIDMMIMPSSGGEPKSIFKADVIEFFSRSRGIKWSWDGKYIYFAKESERDSKIGLFRISVQGGTLESTGFAFEGLHDFYFSPDGKEIAFCAAAQPERNIWVMENVFSKEVKENTEFSIRKVSDFGTEGAVSPDGKYLSYVDWNSGNGELAIYEIATGEKRHLTNYGSESDGFPLYSRWSPDSKQLVYDWYDKNGHVDFCIVGLDGSKPRTLYNNKEVLWAQTYGWSPDGKQILAIFYRKTNYQIVLVSTTDGSVRDLKTLETGWPDLNMCFSPDSRYIVYNFQQKEDSPERDITILPINGTSEIPLVKHPANDYVLGWAPDGKNILFASDRGNNLGVWVIQFLDGKVQETPKLVKANIGQVYPMGFTQKGSFYYGINDNMREIFLAELDPETHKIIAQLKKLSTHFEGSLTQPTYSPDGKYITYTLHIMFSDVLCIHSLENDQEKYFYPKLKRIQQPRWSPDGRLIFFGGWDLIGKKGIYSMDIQSGIFTLIVPPAKESSEMFIAGIELSPDGKEIFLTRISNNLTKIMSRNLISGAEKELYRESHRTSIDFSCSPDGKWLALMQVVEERVLKIIPVTGGEPKELYKFKKNDNPAFFKWTPDGKHIIFNNLGSEGKKFSLWRISVEGGEPQKVGLESNYRVNASIHPDGKHIVFSSPVSTGENSGNWVMENFLPKEKK